MENKEFYIKYEDNQAVKVSTHIDAQRVRRDFPLEDVADLIAAFQSLPGCPLATVFAGDITLHNVVDRVEKSALEPDSPLSAITTGTTAKTALVIKSKNHVDTAAGEFLHNCT